MDLKAINIILYFASRIKNLYVTKLLKLIYIVDETSVIETGSPSTKLNYNVWKLGTVNVDLFNELNFYDFNKLNDYISLKSNSYGRLVKAKVKYDEDEFSLYELELLDRIVEKYGKMTSDELVKLLHKKRLSLA